MIHHVTPPASVATNPTIAAVRPTQLSMNDQVLPEGASVFGIDSPGEFRSLTERGLSYDTRFHPLWVAESSPEVPCAGILVGGTQRRHPERNLNGDQTDQGRALQMNPKEMQVFRVTLYTYTGQDEPSAAVGRQD